MFIRWSYNRSPVLAYLCTQKQERCLKCYQCWAASRRETAEDLMTKRAEGTKWVGAWHHNGHTPSEPQSPSTHSSGGASCREASRKRKTKQITCTVLAVDLTPTRDSTLEKG